MVYSNLGPMKNNVMNEEMKLKVSEKLTLVLNSLENTGVASPLGAVPVPIQAVISHVSFLEVELLSKLPTIFSICLNQQIQAFESNLRFCHLIFTL